MELNFDIKEAVAELQAALHKEFSYAACRYDIVFKGKTYIFEPWTTFEEKKQQEQLRKECIRLLLFDHVEAIVDHLTFEHTCSYDDDTAECNCLIKPENLIIGTLRWSSYKKEDHEIKIASDPYLIGLDQIKEEIHQNVKDQRANDKKITELISDSEDIK
jgi:hypothetical protein